MNRLVSSARPQVTLEAAGTRRLRVARWRAQPSGRAATARPLLIVSGIGMNFELIAPLAKALAPREVITFDMPGIGGSPDPVLPYSIASMALTTAALLDQLQVEAVDVLGISWGGAVAQQFAFQHRARTGRLVLAATSPGLAMIFGNPTMLRHLADPTEYTVKRTLKRNMAMLFAGGGADAPISLNAATPPSLIGWSYQLAAIAGWTSLPFLPLLDLPVLIAAGEDDQVVPRPNAELLKQLIPGARLELFRRGGHLFMLSQANRFAAVLHEFLDQPNAAAAAA